MKVLLFWFLSLLIISVFFLLCGNRSFCFLFDFGNGSILFGRKKNHKRKNHLNLKDLSFPPTHQCWCWCWCLKLIRTSFVVVSCNWSNQYNYEEFVEANNTNNNQQSQEKKGRKNLETQELITLSNNLFIWKHQFYNLTKYFGTSKNYNLYCTREEFFFFFFFDIKEQIL